MATFLHDFVNLWKVKDRRKPTLRYHVNLCKMSRELINKFELSSCDAETKDFVRWASNGSYIRLFLADALHALWASRTTANGLLNRGGMFVLSTAQATSLLRPADKESELTESETETKGVRIHQHNNNNNNNYNDETIGNTDSISNDSNDSNNYINVNNMQNTNTNANNILAHQSTTAASTLSLSNESKTEASTNITTTTDTVVASHNNNINHTNETINSKNNKVHFDTLLDIGAGDGGVTAKLAPLFNSVHVTEASSSMRWRLRQRGYILENWQNPFASTTEPHEGATYDVISCLNVLDRADTPHTLLRNIHDALPSNGLLLLAVVMPWCPMVEEGSVQRLPREKLPMTGGECLHGASYEASVQVLVENVLKPCGFDLIRWTRLPYLCEGNTAVEYALLSDAVFVLQKKKVINKQESDEDTKL